MTDLDTASDPISMIDMTVELVSAYVSRNHVQAGELPLLISTVHQALADLGTPAPAAEQPTALKPAVPVKKSVFDTHLVSLIDGKSYQSLKRHLGTNGFTPDSYRTAYGLPKDYPMVAKGYAAKRSALAKTIGLGRKAAATAPATSEPEATVAEAPKKRGRPKAA